MRIEALIVWADTIKGGFMTLKFTLTASTFFAISAFLVPSSYAQNAYHGASTYDAHAACKQGESKRKLVGAGVGTVVGGVAGSKIAKSGKRTKGAVIGGVVGGAVGYGIADKTIDCDPVYPNGTQYQSAPHPYTTQTSHGAQYGQTYQTTGYTTTHTSPAYPVRTIVSDHPVYNNPSYGGTSTRTYHSTQPQVVRSHSSTVTHHYPQSQPTYVTRQTTPVTTYTRTRSRTVHYHGKHACHVAH